MIQRGVENLQHADVSSSSNVTHCEEKTFYHSLSFLTALCPDLSDPANGTVTVMGTSVGDTASYTCNDGFELIGSMSVTCTSDGTWSDQPPMCRRKLKQC